MSSTASNPPAVEHPVIAAHERYHESLNNLTPADVFYGRGQQILNKRENIKLKTLALRKQMHYRKQLQHNLMS